MSYRCSQIYPVYTAWRWVEAVFVTGVTVSSFGAKMAQILALIPTEFAGVPYCGSPRCPKPADIGLIYYMGNSYNQSLYPSTWQATGDTPENPRDVFLHPSIQDPPWGANPLEVFDWNTPFGPAMTTNPTKVGPYGSGCAFTVKRWQVEFYTRSRRGTSIIPSLTALAFLGSIMLAGGTPAPRPPRK